MAAHASGGASGSSVRAGGDDPECTIEINVKTMDGQVRKLRVKKNETVLSLKEKIANAAGIPVDHQRLIFRGRVLNDNHSLLSEYYLEDGCTLHLVARRTTTEGQHSSGTSEESTHANVNVAENGGILGYLGLDDLPSEGMIGGISRDILSMLDAFGLGVPDDMENGSFSVATTFAPQGANNVGRTHTGNPAQPRFSIPNHQIRVPQFQPGGAIPRNMVVYCSFFFFLLFRHLYFILILALMTGYSMMILLGYINRMDQVLQNNGIPSVDSNAQQQPRSDDAYLNQRFPSPEHLAQRIQRDAATSDTSIRSQIQNESAQLAVAMLHLGAMLLELGRTMTMLRMGTSPANAFVNAGSAIYINPTGPNPIMVQPSFQSAPRSGVSSIPVLGAISGPSPTSDANINGGKATSLSNLHQACERTSSNMVPLRISLVLSLKVSSQAFGEDESIQVMLEELARGPESLPMNT